MRFRIYTSIKNITDYQQGIPIPCYPNAQNGNDVAVDVNPDDVVILSNQSALYICKKPNLVQKLFKKRDKSTK